MVEREYHDHDAHAGHDHDDNYRSAGRRSLIIVLILLCCHMGIEIAGGILSGSLGLLAHATHMMTDAVAIGLALFAMWIAERPATITRTFGYHRTEVLVVMFNALALWVLPVGFSTRLTYGLGNTPTDTDTKWKAD